MPVILCEYLCVFASHLTCLPPVNPEDYEASTSTTIEFSRCSRRECAPSITFVNDRMVENNEFFELIITSLNADLVQTSPTSATVIIQDDSESE